MEWIFGIKEILIAMLNEKTPEENLYYVSILVVFLIFVIIIDKISPDSFDKIINPFKYVIFLLTIVKIFHLFVYYNSIDDDKKTPQMQLSGLPVRSMELPGLYKGRYTLLNSANVSDIKVTPDCRIDIDSRLNCILYSEMESSEQSLGPIQTITDPTSALLLPKLGWAVCYKNENLIHIVNDTLKNKYYSFNFTKNGNN